MSDGGVVIVAAEFPPQRGGVGTHLYEMAKHWCRTRPVVVIAPSCRPTRDADAFPFAVAEYPAAENVAARLSNLVRRIRTELRARQPAMVYSGHWRATGVATRLALLRHRPTRYVQAIHGSEVLYLLASGVTARLHRPLFRWTVSRAHALVALGENQARLLEQLGIERGRIVVSPEGVDLSRFDEEPPGDGELVREKYGIEDRPALLTVGRLVERKGHDMVIRALPTIRAAVPDVRYLVVGAGPREAYLRRLASASGVEEAVAFCGEVPEEELISHYRACDIFVMPNREVGGDVEGFGIVFMEAAACGKPTIGGRSGGAPEAIVHDHTGLLVDGTSVSQVADACLTLLQHPDRARALGKNGQRRAFECFGYDRIARSILERTLVRAPHTE